MSSKDIHRPSGRRLDGPPMRPPSDIARLTAAARAQATSRSLQGVNVAPHTQPAQRSFTPGRGRGAGAPGKATTRSTQSLQSSSGTGINRWWRYQEENIPGGGHVMANIGTGNVLIQDDDMVIPHKGIAMAFRRTYNSQSLHDVGGSDGSQPGMYGNGWTNTFDAHIVKSSDGMRSVYDVDGARYDYAMPTNPSWTAGMILQPATPGNYAYLQYDGQCGWYWIKKSGTVYYFYVDLTDPGTNCPANGTLGAYSGRLYRIYGRNYNTYLTFSYSWDQGDASIATGKVSQIAVQAESGMTAILNFADVSGHRVLDGLWFPDGTTYVAYGYDTQGNLTNVSRPPNNAAGNRPSHGYGYVQQGSGGPIISWADSPRWAKGGPDGAVTAFAFTGSSPATATLNAMARFGTVNPIIPDGTNSGPLQYGYSTSLYEYYDEYFTTGAPAATFRDTDGHATNWVVDSLGRVTQTQECVVVVNQACSGTPLTTNESWDASNNLISESDARGNVTDYAYDVDGNTIAVAQPAPSGGGFRPTSLYTYGAYDNLVAYCDPLETHALQADWTSRPVPPIPVGAGSCPTQGSANWRAAYAYPWYEPFGELVSMTTPSGYTHTFAYAPGQQAGADFGLPTAVTGDAIAQLDGTTRTPAQTFWYDATGNLRCYSKGNGTTVLSYDALARLVSVADPDDSSANGGSLCGKSTGTSGWNTQTTYTYYPDGSKQSAQSPSERAFGVSTSYTYDVDGNVVTETAHHGCVPNQVCNPGVTQKWYDGVDRLVEVAQPHDSRTLSNPAGQYDGDQWSTRYLYDLSQGGTVALTGSSTFHAYGNLFKTQSLIAGWTDVRGSAFDALDRETMKYSYSVASGPPDVGTGGHQLETTALQYDLDSASLGLLAKKTNPNNESVTYTYDEHGRVASENYAGDAGRTAAETYLYDANGRKYAITSSQYGVQQYGYDPDGRLTSSIEPTGGGLTSPAQIAYGYYADGMRSTVSVTSSGLTRSNALVYSYRSDGLLRTQTVNASVSGTWSKQYTDGGRLTGVSGVDTQSRSYDTSGQLATYSVSAGTATYTHDPEGSVLTEYLPNVLLPGAGGTVPETITSTLNVRGELIDSAITPVGNAPHRRMSTNSGCTATSTIPDDLSNYDPSTDLTTNPMTCDRMNGISIAADSSIQTTIYDGAAYPNGTKNDESFDATGRVVQVVHTTYGWIQRQGSQAHVPLQGSGDVGPDSGGPIGGPMDIVSSRTQITSNRAYDAENHLRSVQYTIAHTNKDNQTVTSTGPATTIGWGPNGHPANINAASGNVPSNETLHWDGDLILFVTDAAGNLTDFKAGLDGDITPRDMTYKGLSVYDRDPAGVIVETSNSTGSTGFNPLDPNTVSGAGAGGTTGYQAVNVPEQYVRDDGFMVAGVQINGVRAYDPKLSAWTTPDAYEGDVHDPASQQRYMFNRGNAVDYSDPSGYDPMFSPMWDPRSPVIRMPGSPARDMNTQGLPFNKTAAQNGAAHGKLIGGAIATLASWAIPGGGKIADVAVSFATGQGMTWGGEKAGEAIGKLAGFGTDPGPVSGLEERAGKILQFIDFGKTAREAVKALTPAVKAAAKRGAEELRHAVQSRT